MSEVINKNCGIYKITSPSGLVYIGQSVSIDARWKNYKNINRIKNQVKLYRSIKKYGWVNHQFDVIEYCSVENLNCSERFWQDIFDVTGKGGLNCILTECGNLRGQNCNNKEVVNTITGEEYRSATLCAEVNNIKSKSFFMDKLSGRSNNNTPFIYKKDLHLKDTRANQQLKDQKGENHPMFGKGELARSAKKVVCTKTGKLWSTVKQCAKENNVNEKTLGYWLRGVSPNKSTFKYLD